jgi:uncharacterized protein with PIN domain
MSSVSRKQAAVVRRRQIQLKAAGLEPSGECRFIADVMLGRLAKWLRIAGFDVLYSNAFTDDELVARSTAENRILLSRDARLLVRKAVKRFIFLESTDVGEQIRQVFEVTGAPTLPSLLSRCPACNEPLVPALRKSVRDSVPPYVFDTQHAFKSCPQCRRVYWAGTHRESVVRTLTRLTAC